MLQHTAASVCPKTRARNRSAGYVCRPTSAAALCPVTVPCAEGAITQEDGVAWVVASAAWVARKGGWAGYGGLVLGPAVCKQRGAGGAPWGGHKAYYVLKCASMKSSGYKQKSQSVLRFV